MDCGIMHKFSDLKTLKNRRKRNQRFYFRNLKNKQARKFKETTPEILYETSIQIPQRSRSRKLIFNRIWDESKQDYIIKGNKANVNEGYPTQLPRATNKITPRIATLICGTPQTRTNHWGILQFYYYTPINVITTINYSLINSTHPFSILG